MEIFSGSLCSLPHIHTLSLLLLIRVLGLLLDFVSSKPFPHLLHLSKFYFHCPFLSTHSFLMFFCPCSREAMYFWSMLRMPHIPPKLSFVACYRWFSWSSEATVFILFCRTSTQSLVLSYSASNKKKFVLTNDWQTLWADVWQRFCLLRTCVKGGFLLRSVLGEDWLRVQLPANSEPSL